MATGYRRRPRPPFDDVRAAARRAAAHKYRARIDADDAFAVAAVLRVLADGQAYLRRDLMHRTNIIRGARFDHVIGLLAGRLVVAYHRLQYRVPPEYGRGGRGGRKGTYYQLKKIEATDDLPAADEAAPSGAPAGRPNA